MSRAVANQRDSEGAQAGENVMEFLKCELPPQNSVQASYYAEALGRAGRRYDRYSENRADCLDYAARKRRLIEATRMANQLASQLCDLDILSRDELTLRLDPTQLETLVGSLLLLSKEVGNLASEVQKGGRPRDLPEERWIIELADIYENAFGKPASVWGSGDEPAKRRGTFYRLLELSRPEHFPRRGKLSVRQIDRTLKRRRNGSTAHDLRITGRGEGARVLASSFTNAATPAV